MLNRRNLLLGSAMALGAVSMPAVLRAQSGPLRIGLITTLSGPGQVYGQYIKAGAALAVARINAEGGVNGHQVELVVRDEKNSPDGSMAANREVNGNCNKVY